MTGFRALLSAAFLMFLGAAGGASAQDTSVPVIYMPAGGVAINTPRPTIVWRPAWAGDPLIGYKIRLSTNDSAYGMVIYDSGMIDGTVPIHTLNYTPPANTQLYAFVWEKHLIGGEIGWSPNQNGGFVISSSMPGPAPLASFTATPGDREIALAWRNPPSASFTGTMIRYKTSGCPISPTDGNLLVDRPGGPNTDDSYIHTGLGYGTYYYSAFAHDATPNYATQLYALAMPFADDGVPPAPVAAFRAVKGVGRNVLSWRNPDDADFAGTMIRYKTTGYPTGPTDGTLLVDRPASKSTPDSYVHTGTSQNLTCYYAAFAYDAIPNYAAGANVAAVELTQPNLRIHPDNPHYFQDTYTGKPVMITGYASIVPSATDFDYVAGVAELGSRRVGYSRVWHFLPWSQSRAIWPWGRSSVVGAPMGGNKIDMNTWNETYWTRMRDALVSANEVGTIGEIHLFDRCGMSPAGSTRWYGNPWAYENNINNLETPTVTSDGTPEFYQWSSRPNLRNQQERYVRKMIDETIVYPNVIYEIENEHWEAPSVGWADHYAQFVKDYIAANYPGSPRLVSYNSILSDADLDTCYLMPALDVVNKHYGGSLESNPSLATSYIEARWGYNKPINIDEFANGVGDPAVLRRMCWTIVASGGNFHIEDCGLSAKPFDICENIRSFRAASGWDFIHSSPRSSLIVSGMGACMENPGVEYVFYFRTGGNMTINVAAGAYREEWWNPRTGGFYNVTSYTHAGGNRTVSAPDSSDWVLHLTTQPAPTAVLQSRAAGEIRVDGSPGDWNLAQLARKITAGDVGSGQMAVIGYDTNGVFYQGNHASGEQYPPSNPADSAVKVYSRHDEAYLYFLARCEDDDICCPYAVGSNYLNDCVRIYVDPGYDRGASSLSNSTSDIELVIDADNRKNVYGCVDAYKNRVLAGVTSAVARDSTGWWMEARIAKSALDPALPEVGSIGIDFCIHDNDGNDSARSTTYTWRDSSADGFPSKVPDRWGELNLRGAPTPPGDVTAFAAVAGNGQVTLSWTNPPDVGFSGVMIRYRTDTYPLDAADGMLVIEKPGSPGANDSTVHTGLAGGVSCYYRAFAHDSTPEYASGVTASATPFGAPTVISNSPFDSGADGWTISVWKAGTYSDGTMAWASSGGNPGGCMRSTGSGATDNDNRCLREGGEISKIISTAGYSGIRIYYDLKVNSLGGSYTGVGTNTCAVDHNLVDEQLTVFYSTDGGANWTEAQYLLRGALLTGYQSFGARTIDLSGVSACNNNPSFALRFRWQFNQASDTGWLDNIRVTGNAIVGDVTPPGAVTGFAAIQGNKRNFLIWRNPPDADLAGVRVVAKTTGYPTGPADGTVVYQGIGASATHASLANGTAWYYAAYAYDQVPNYSAPAQASAAPAYFTPVQAKMLPDNTPLTLTVGVVSAAFGDAFYVQCVDAACGVSGIKCVKAAHGVAVGQSATVRGTILTDAATGERCIAATWVNGSGSSTVAPVAMGNLMLGGADWNYDSVTGAGQRGIQDGAGTNNIGLLVRVWGRVTQRDTAGLTYYYLDDGSALRDTTQTAGADNVGVRVKAAPTGYPAGAYVAVTGISSCFKDAGGSIRRQVIPIPEGIQVMTL